jgi:hypothetical protein
MIIKLATLEGYYVTDVIKVLDIFETMWNGSKQPYNG